MSEKRRDTVTAWQKKFDAHVITPEEYEEIPELTDEWFDRGVLHVEGVPVRRGRPKSDKRKTLLSVRLDTDIIDHFRATGPGWQGRINDALRKAARLRPARPPRPKASRPKSARLKPARPLSARPKRTTAR